MRETWYVLENGSCAHPREVAPDDKGRLVHISGVAVEMRGEVPRSQGVDAANETARSAPASKDLQVDRPKRAYKRRDVTAG